MLHKLWIWFLLYLFLLLLHEIPLYQSLLLEYMKLFLDNLGCVGFKAVN